MSKSIIINGPRSSGKTTLIDTFSNVLRPEEVLRLTSGCMRPFKEVIKPTDLIRIAIIDSVCTVTEILYQERYLRHVFTLFPSFVRAIYVTQDSDGILSNYADVLSGFTVFSLPEYKAVLKTATYN